MVIRYMNKLLNKARNKQSRIHGPGGGGADPGGVHPPSLTKKMNIRVPPSSEPPASSPPPFAKS